MITQPAISVLIPVYNGEKYLSQAIESILNQTFSDFEFIIINDASTDNSLNIIKSYNDPRIKLINNEKNLKLTKSLNIGLRCVQGGYIARMDADDISLPNRLEKQYQYLGKNKEIALIGSAVEIIDDNNNFLGKRFFPEDFDVIKFGLNLYNQFIHSTIFFRKEIINKIGLYDEKYDHAEDYEFYCRIIKKYKIINIPDVLLRYRIHKASRTQNLLEKNIQQDKAIKIFTNQIKPYLDINQANAKIYYDALYKKTNKFQDLLKAIKIQKDIYRSYIQKEKLGKKQIKKILKFCKQIQNKKFIMGYVKNKMPLLYNIISFIYNKKANL